MRNAGLKRYRFPSKERVIISPTTATRCRKNQVSDGTYHEETEHDDGQLAIAAAMKRQLRIRIWTLSRQLCRKEEEGFATPI